MQADQKIYLKWYLQIIQFKGLMATGLVEAERIRSQPLEALSHKRFGTGLNLSVLNKRNRLESWEVSLIKAMLAVGCPRSDQDILAYFTRPLRSINHRAVAEIRKNSKHANVVAAPADKLQAFMASWPEVDPETGLSLRGDELLIKAREAMISAVHTFNSAGLTFRTELFIVTAVIAWTYLMHAWFKHKGVDYRYTRCEKGKNVVVKTPNGADKYWELAKCLTHSSAPIEKGAKDNLNLLLEIRHEIEHRSTTRIDDELSAKLQACCLNFNDAIKSMFSPRYALERRLPIALQFVTFSPDQGAMLKKESSLPRHVETTMKNFEEKLTPEQQADPRFAYRVYLVHKSVNRPHGADLAVQIVPRGSELSEQFNYALKEVEKQKYRATDVVKKIVEDGWDRFTMRSHTLLWKQLEAKNPSKGYGAFIVTNQWYWYATWLERVREECEKKPDTYRTSQTAY